MRRRDHERIVEGLRDEVRYLRRLNESLTDKLMYATGSTWTPPPTLVPELPELPTDYTWSPEHDLDAAE